MQEDETEEGARSFTRQLELIADGDLVYDASEALNKLLRSILEEARVRHSAATGTFTLKLNFQVEPHGQVEIKPSITTKAAERRLTKGHLWMTPGANLSAANPRQQTLPLREVPKTKAPRDVGRSNEDVKEV